MFLPVGAYKNVSNLNALHLQMAFWAVPRNSGECGSWGHVVAGNLTL